MIDCSTLTPREVWVTRRSPAPLTLILLALAACTSPAPPAAAAAPPHCLARGPLPDATCTPGATMAIDVSKICGTSTRGRRHVHAAVHRQAFAEYGYAYPQPSGSFEVDHLIPLELGGDNAIANLWPEAAEPRPGFHEKDRVEDYLHERVCSGAMSLGEAQRLIATNWVAVWRVIEHDGGAGEDGRP